MPDDRPARPHNARFRAPHAGSNEITSAAHNQAGTRARWRRSGAGRRVPPGSCPDFARIADSFRTADCPMIAVRWRDQGPCQAVLTAVIPGAASEGPVHDVQADQAVPGVIERLGYRADDLEPERLPVLIGGLPDVHDPNSTA
jgi:hypothetical protein